MQHFGIITNENQFLVSHLTTLYGLNRGRALALCARLGYAPKVTRLKHLAPNFFLNIRRDLDRRYRLDKLLKKTLALRLRNHLKGGSYKATRKLWNLPANGQNTRTNAKTARRISLATIPRQFYSPAQRLPIKGTMANKKKVVK